MALSVKVKSSTARTIEASAACDTRVWTIGTRTPASSCRSRTVLVEGMPTSVGGPLKNDVDSDADTQNVGCHRAYAYEICQSGTAALAAGALVVLDARHTADAAYAWYPRTSAPPVAAPIWS